MRDDIIKNTLNVINERMENIRQLLEEVQEHLVDDQNESVSPIDDTSATDNENLITIDQLKILEMVTISIDNFRRTDRSIKNLSDYSFTTTFDKLRSLSESPFFDYSDGLFHYSYPLFKNKDFVDSAVFMFRKDEFAFTMISGRGIFDIADCNIYLTVPGFPTYFLTKKDVHVYKKFSVLDALKNI